MEKEILTTTEVAEFLSLSEITVRNYARRGILPTWWHGCVGKRHPRSRPRINKSPGGRPLRRRTTMLILTLKEDDKILIGDKITVMLVEIRGNQIRLGIEAPAGLLVLGEKLAGKAKA